MQSFLTRLSVLMLTGSLLGLAGCDSEAPKAADGGEVEESVRKVIAEVAKVKPEEIAMDKPLGEAPVSADDMSLMEMVMELEDRHSINIDDDALDHYLDNKDKPIRVTPRQLVEVVQQAKNSDK